MASLTPFSQAGPFQFNAPKEFSGKREDFEEWAYKLRAYMSLINPDYNVHMIALQDKEDEVSQDMFKKRDGSEDTTLVQLAVHLQWMLVTLCTGSASAFLRRETGQNGFESYRKLCQRYMIPGNAKSVGRLSKILRPNLNNGSFEDSFSSWEDEIQKYEKETKSTLSDDVKVAVLLSETRGPLQEHLRLNASTMSNYNDVKDIIVQYFRTKSNFKGQEPTPMEIGAYWNYYTGQGKGPKGKKQRKIERI